MGNLLLCDVRIGDISVTENPEEVKTRIGYLPESNPLYTEMPVIDYLYYVAEIHGIPKKNREERILEMVDICGLEGEKHKLISELSKGYRQRVGLAQALIHDPEVLILDEPTTGLDPNQIVEIRELIKRIGREKTVILSSHILAEVEATCDRILIINKGKIVADGTAEELRKSAQGNEILHVGIEGPDKDQLFNALKEIPSVESVDFLDSKNGYIEIIAANGRSSRKDVFNLCVKNNWELTAMIPIETKLEDVFRNVTMK